MGVRQFIFGNDVQSLFEEGYVFSVSDLLICFERRALYLYLFERDSISRVRGELCRFRCDIEKWLHVVESLVSSVGQKTAENVNNPWMKPQQPSSGVHREKCQSTKQ